MSSKTVDENYKRLRAELDERLSKDKRLTAIADKISKGAADFSDTARYTQIVSKHMSDVIKRNIGELKQPMAKEMVCKELLRDHYELINGVFGEVQVSVDKKLGIHLNPIKPAYPAERVDKWAHSLEDPTVEPSVTERRAASGSENIGNSIHDDCIKENAKVREQAGLDCYLTRDAGGGCCPWCQALEGRYEYASAPDDIFRRHDNCTCTVTYECGKMRQDVWSKRTWEASLEELQARKDAAEAAKPTVNTPEQAKELEKLALEKNPVTKLTPEQAKAIDEQSKPVVNTPEQAKELEKSILDNSQGKNTTSEEHLPPTDDKSQDYRPVILDKENEVVAKRDYEVKTYRAITAQNEIYISENADIKPKKLHQIDENVSAALDRMGISDKENLPKVMVITRDDMATNAVASYRAKENQFLICDEFAVYKAGEMPDAMMQLACGNNDLSSYIHELYHWVDAESYRSQYGEITDENYNHYVNYINERAKKRLDKLSAKGYNILVSEYAQNNVVAQKFYEIYTEFRTYQVLGGV